MAQSKQNIKDKINLQNSDPKEMQIYELPENEFRIIGTKILTKLKRTQIDN